MYGTYLIEYPYAKNIFSVNGSLKLGQIADGKDIFYWMCMTLEMFLRKLYWRKKPADLSCILSANTIDAILLLRHACFQ